MSFDGTWNCVMKTPVGPQNVSITLQHQGDVLNGNMSGGGLSTPIESGKASGENATWIAKLTKPMAVTLDFNVTVKDNELAGKVKFGMFGSGELKGTRAQLRM